MNTPSAARSLSPDEAFERLGRITRQLHESMNELGFAEGLMEVAHQIPDARDRLSHVGQMTESAANKVLDLVDVAQPQCHNFKTDSEALAVTLARLKEAVACGSSEVSELLATCQTFSNQAIDFAQAQHAFLSDIMMTQDFQDLSGQIIKKVIGIISLTEQQLLSLLMHSAPEHLSSAGKNSELAGPQAPAHALQQDDVDDLLASLGF
jgi:chemotaxis protein CheZ